jgi:hypothetical protein
MVFEEGVGRSNFKIGRASDFNQYADQWRPILKCEHPTPE